jgi:hypothetical protein
MTIAKPMDIIIIVHLFEHAMHPMRVGHEQTLAPTQFSIDFPFSTDRLHHKGIE